MLRLMVKKFSEFHKFLEKDERKKSAEYKKLTPKMKRAVDDVFSTLESNPSNFMSSFEKTVKKIAKKYGVKDSDIMSYFDKEMLSI